MPCRVTGSPDAPGWLALVSHQKLDPLGGNWAARWSIKPPPPLHVVSRGRSHESGERTVMLCSMVALCEQLCLYLKTLQFTFLCNMHTHTQTHACYQDFLGSFLWLDFTFSRKEFASKLLQSQVKPFPINISSDIFSSPGSSHTESFFLLTLCQGTSVSVLFTQ